MKQIITLIFITLLTACVASPEEKEMRRSNAFDISGNYTVANFESNQITSIEIFNESDRSNVYLQLSRNNFTRDEEVAFDRQKISLNDVEKLRRNFQIGKGRPLDLSGGENISKDYGQTTSLYVLTNKNEKVSIGNFEVLYSFNAKMAKDSNIISGNLTLIINETVKENNTYTIYFRERIDIPVTAKNNSLTQSQNIGTWSGQIQSNEDVIKQAFQKITIEKLSESFYTVKPSREEFYINGEKFVFNAKSFPMKNLNNPTPTISISFLGENKNQIQFNANIYALGMMMGSVSKVEASENETLAQIHFKRN